jgi:glycosyltransferase involved in cell wall biosynthesis
MLARALACLGGQARPPDEVVVVNDGGAVDPVRQLVKTFGDAFKIVLLEHPQSLGRAGALNAGIRAANGDWFAILDDDDTWEPEFVDEMMGVIERRAWVAAACQTLVILEEVDVKGRIRQLDKGILNPDFVAVDLAMLAAWNQFTINALVFSRTAWTEIGAFRDDLPVLEDWEFNVRLARSYEIGVVAKPLAHYRKRPASHGSLANTLEHDHRTVHHRIINEWLREDLRLGRSGIGQLATIGLLRRDMQRLNPLVRVYEKVRHLWRRVLGRNL